MREEDRALLEELLLARGPGGQEDEVRAICQRELEGCCDEVGSDAAGNLVARISPPHLPREQARRAAVRLLAHLDEIAMIVKRVEADGTLRVVALGGAQPVSFGVCPVQILAGEAVLDGVLSYGSMHATGESPQGSDVLSGAVHWRDVHVVTRRSAEEAGEPGRATGYPRGAQPSVAAPVVLPGLRRRALPRRPRTAARRARRGSRDRPAPR